MAMVNNEEVEVGLSQYKLLHAARPEALERSVETFLRLGWVLQGGVSFHMTQDGWGRDRLSFVQAMVWPADRPILESLEQ